MTYPKPPGYLQTDCDICGIAPSAWWVPVGDNPGTTSGRSGMRIPTTPLDRPWLVAWSCFIPVALLRAGSIAEDDTFWQVRTGLAELHRGQLLRTDELSWTAAGQPWVQNSWLFNVLDAIAYRLGGLAGVALFGAVLALAVAAVVLRLSRAAGATPLAATTALMAYLPLLIVAFNVRPQLVDYLAFGLALLILRHMWAGRHLARGVALLTALAIAWANLHPATPTLVVLCVVLAGASLPLRSRRTTAALAGAALGVAVGTVVNPYGLRVVTQGLSIAREASRYVFEWRHADLTDVWQLGFILVALLAAREYRRRGEPVLLGATVVTLGFYLVAVRYLPWVIVAAVPGLALAASRPPLGDFLVRRRPVLVAGVVALSLVAAPSLAHLGRPDPGQFAPRVVTALPDHCRLFNVDTTGGLVSLVRPDVLVAADGRVEVYGAALLYRIRLALSQPDLAQDLLSRATCAVVPPTSGLAHRLSGDPAWRHARTEGPMALFIRTATG